MVDEKITDVEETEVEEEVNVSEDVACVDDEICENDMAEEGVQEIAVQVADVEKKSSNKGLIVNAVLTGLMLIVLVANLIVTFGNSDKIKAVESDLADVKEVLSYGLTGSPYNPLDFAEVAGELREERKKFEEAMKDLEKQQAPAEESESAPEVEEKNEAPADNQ